MSIIHGRGVSLSALSIVASPGSVGNAVLYALDAAFSFDISAFGETMYVSR